jgi:hypothetical protein
VTECQISHRGGEPHLGEHLGMQRAHGAAQRGDGVAQCGVEPGEALVAGLVP